MKQEILRGIGFLLVASSVAFAQNAPTAAGNTATAVVPPPSSPAAAKAGGAQVDGASLQQTLADNLKKAGYTDVKIWPDAFIVEAKNKSGAPTMMFLTPNSMTVFTAQDAHGQDTRTATGGAPTKP